MCISCNNLTHAHTLYMGAGVGTSNKNRPQTQANDAGSERSLENFCCFFVFTFCAEDFLLAHPGRRFGQQRHAQSKLSSVTVQWLWFGAPIACGEVQLSLHSLLHCHLQNAYFRTGLALSPAQTVVVKASAAAQVDVWFSEEKKLLV